MNVVFLDFDGVINTYYWTKQENGLNKCFLPSSGCEYVSNFQAICWLNDLCLKERLSIVITSTWRKYCSLKQLRQILYRSGLDSRISIVGVTPILNEESYPRGKEIRLFLKEHSEIQKLIILDDDSDMYEFMPYLVCCNTYHGFGIPEQKEAEKILKQQEVFEWKQLEPIDNLDEVKQRKRGFIHQNKN